MLNNFKFSVIIPIYKDWNRLRSCIDALKKQSISPSDFEILIINNEKDAAIPEGIEWPKNAKLLHEPVPGSYAARNRGIIQAKGEILAFTDSDCIPDKDWLKNAWRYFLNEDVERIGGKISLFFKDGNKVSNAELYERVFAFNQKHSVQNEHVSVTANFLVRRSCFLRVGLFDPTKFSGEDWGWNRRASELNMRILYAGDVVVKHPARWSVEELVRKSRRTFGGREVPKGFLKRLRLFYHIFKTKFIKPVKQLIRTKELSFREKWRVSYVIVYLYVIISFEYIRRLSGGHPARN